MPTLPIQARATTGVGKPQADSEGNERIPPDGFGVAALENCCPQASPRGDAGIALYTFPRAIPHKERLATLHAICLQISLQSLFRIFPHASCVHIFRDISGKYSKIHKGFSPFFPSSLKKSDDAICIRQIRNRLSYFTKMLVNTSSIHSAFCFI